MGVQVVVLAVGGWAGGQHGWIESGPTSSLGETITPTVVKIRRGKQSSPRRVLLITREGAKAETKSPNYDHKVSNESASDANSLHRLGRMIIEPCMCRRRSHGRNKLDEPIAAKLSVRVLKSTIIALPPF